MELAGITKFHDAGSSFRTIDLLKRDADEGKLGRRLYVTSDMANEALTPQILAGYKLTDYGASILGGGRSRRPWTRRAGERGFGYLRAAWEDYNGTKFR